MPLADAKATWAEPPHSGALVNRSELHYTGALLAGIVGQDGFGGVGRFLDLVPGLAPQDGSAPDIRVEAWETEFSLRKSRAIPAMRKLLSRFDAPQGGEVPDVLLLVQVGERRLLLVIEGKMFEQPSRPALLDQMARERLVAEPLGRLWEADLVQVALIPSALRCRLEPSGVEPFRHPVVTWDALLAAYGPPNGNPWLLALQRALDRYPDLVGSGAGTNATTKLGSDIVADWRAGTLKATWMGRQYGKTGKWLKSDLESDGWKTWPYQVSEVSMAGNANWFPVHDFIKLVGDRRI